MDLRSIKDAIDQIVKRQELISSKSQEIIDQVEQEIEQILAKIQPIDSDWIFVDVPSSSLNMKSILSNLNHKLNVIAPLKQIKASQNDFDINLRKFSKLLDETFPDTAKANRNVNFDTHALNGIIARHFHQQGMTDIGDCLITAAREQEQDETRMRNLFLEIHSVLESLREREDIEPALKWISANRELLKPNDSVLEFKLYSILFVEIIRKGNSSEALDYATAYLAPFAVLNKDDLEKLMVSLLYIGKLENYPFPELLITREMLAEEFTKHACNAMGLPSRSPLITATAAGTEGLSTLLKLANVMSARKEMTQLQVPVELGKEFQFYSVFVCPVSREEAGKGNPPMLMTCRHVLCHESIMKMSKQGSKKFKCPYCPAMVSASECKQLHF